MVKHTEIVRRKQSTNCLSLFDHFVGLALKGLNGSVDGMLIFSDYLRIVNLSDFFGCSGHVIRANTIRYFMSVCNFALEKVSKWHQLWCFEFSGHLI